MQTRIFCNIHVELGSGKSLGGHKGGAKMLYRILGNQNSACMYAQVIREPVEPRCILQYEAYGTVVATACRPSTRQCLSFMGRQTQYFGQFTNQGPILKRNVCAQKSNIGETMKNVSDDPVAFLPGKINIEIGRIAAVEVDEPLEIKVQFDGVDLGNLKQISHQAVGTTAPTYIKEAATAGIFQYFPIDEKIRYIALLPDDFQLLFQPGNHLFGCSGVEARQVETAQPTQEPKVEFLLASIGLLVFVGVLLPEFKMNATAIG